MSRRTDSVVDIEKGSEEMLEFRKTHFPSVEQVQQLSDAHQSEFAERSAIPTLRLLQLLKRLLAAQHALCFPQLPALDAQLGLSDIEVNRSLTTNDQYSRLVLWKLISTLNLKTLRSVDSLLQNGSEISTVSAAPSSTSSFRDYYMSKLTELFHEELDQLRQEPNFDGRKLSLLVDALQTGADVFSADECIAGVTRQSPVQAQNPAVSK